ncbi:MAG: redoxin domain-containing protein [Deltaproteobacteria bacterium]|nr:redoxin domain-containing protein [Deltaproteobacteria bacterium]
MRFSPVIALALTFLASGILACSDDARTGDTATAPAAAAGSSPSTPTERGEVELAVARRPDERPLPSFGGRDLDGKRLSISDFIGKRLLIFFFNPEVDEAGFVGDAVSAVAKLSRKYNFTVVGVSMASTPPKTRAFLEKAGLDIPVFSDSTAAIAGRMGIRQPLVIFGVDAEGYFEFAMGHFAPDVPDPAGVVEEQLREKLRLPDAVATGDPGALDSRPQAPLFEADKLDGSEPFSLAEVRGKPVVLVFFLHTCPHCHHALAFFEEQLEKFPEEQRPILAAISMYDRPATVRAALREEGLDYFPVLYDSDESIRREYGVFGGFPDILLIDASGKIVHRSSGWREDRDPSLIRMYLAKIAGSRIPMLLNPRGYTGSDVCVVCHEVEGQTWEFTQHANAFDTLVTHGENRNGECVSCHVIGFDEPGGYSFKEQPTHLEDVGCESCHGRGGGHLSPDSPKTVDYQPACLTCHNPTHSLGFDYATFLPKVSHASIATLSNPARQELLAQGGKIRNVLPKSADYVGSEACKSCHEAEHATWSSSPHRHAVDTLAIEGKQDERQCLECHTTAMGLPGGFPTDGKVRDHPNVASVGCESCHGPGGDHIGENAKRFGTIVSLGDKCDSCVILQICGSCHDDANDPGFEFEVQQKIDKQRHGTTEAGTGKPLGTSARSPSFKNQPFENQPLENQPEAGLARAFQLLDERG